MDAIEKMRQDKWLSMYLKIFPEGYIYVDPGSGQNYKIEDGKFKCFHRDAFYALKKKTSYEWFINNVWQ